MWAPSIQIMHRKRQTKMWSKIVFFEASMLPKYANQVASSALPFRPMVHGLWMNKIIWFGVRWYSICRKWNCNSMKRRKENKLQIKRNFMVHFFCRSKHKSFNDIQLNKNGNVMVYLRRRRRNENVRNIGFHFSPWITIYIMVNTHTRSLTRAHAHDTNIYKFVCVFEWRRSTQLNFQ